MRDGERSLPYAFIASGGQIGLLIVGSLGSWLAHLYKWDFLFEIIGLLSFGWILGTQVDNLYVYISKKVAVIVDL